jgi:hypothetical protein
MALARPASNAIAAAPAAPAPAAPAARPARPSQPGHPARQAPLAQPAPFSPADFAATHTETRAAPTIHIRRCNWRRVTALPKGRRELQMYDVECMHPGYDAAMPLGDLVAAHTACAGCTLPGVFRPDED